MSDPTGWVELELAEPVAVVHYRFALPADVTGGTLTLDIGNQFRVRVSPDNAS